MYVMETFALKLQPRAVPYRNTISCTCDPEKKLFTVYKLLKRLFEYVNSRWALIHLVFQLILCPG